ncbi:UBX domain-containing protein 10 [Lecanora helva]
MSAATIDPSQLNGNQQEALGTYTAVTNQEPAAAISLLQRSEWNVQIAIAKFFDGEAPDPLAEARAALPSPSPPSRSARRETILNGSTNFPRSPRSPPREPAPRIVPQPENQKHYQPSLLFSIILTPFNILYRLLSSSFSFFGYIFPFLPRLLPRLAQGSTPARSRTGRRSLNPRDTAARFAREFEEEFGRHDLQFYDGGYAQAYDLAKKELKFLMVVLLSPEHDDTGIFVRDTLLAQETVDYLNTSENRIILWAGNVQDSEAYQVSNALNCSKFPFAALVVHTPQDSSTSMSTVARLTGLQPASAFVAKLQTALAQHSQSLDRIRAARSEQQATRNLREEQNSAYERSLAQDRERARQRREAEAAQKRAEEEARTEAERAEREAQQLAQWKQWRAQSLLAEPGPEIKDATRVSIRLTNGERVIRKFSADAEMEELYAFVECYDSSETLGNSASVQKPVDYDHKYNFRLVSPMPRSVFEIDVGGTLATKLGRSGNLIVEPINDEDDENDDE